MAAARRRQSRMRASRLASFVLAAAAAVAGGAVTAQPADARPIPVRMDPDAIARLQADNDRLRAERDALRDALAEIDRINHHSRDREARRRIDHVIDSLRDRDHDGDRDRDRDRADARPLAPPDFDELRGHVADARFEQDRVELVRTASAHALFTVDQVVALMQTSSFDDTRVDIATLLRPRVVDPARWYLVEAALQFESSRDTLRQRVGQ